MCVKFFALLEVCILTVRHWLIEQDDLKKNSAFLLVVGDLNLDVI